jgi:hypothetical protein
MASVDKLTTIFDLVPSLSELLDDERLLIHVHSYCTYMALFVAPLLSLCLGLYSYIESKDMSYK